MRGSTVMDVQAAADRVGWAWAIIASVAALWLGQGGGPCPPQVPPPGVACLDVVQATDFSLLYLAVESTAAAVVAGYVLSMRRRSRVGDFWISARAERLAPAVFLLAAFVALLAVLVLLDAPQDLSLMTLSMGLASAAVAGITLLWKASAHCTVAGHAAAAGLLLLGPPGLVFLLVLPPIVWSRVTLKAHTLSQTLAGAAVGAGFAVLFLA
jgi:membrane-associated phospholipid phosphatase